MSNRRRHAFFAACLGLLALGACADVAGERAVEAGVADRRWSEGRLPRYGAPRPVEAPLAEGAAREAAGKTAPPLKVGLLLPLSGPYADYGRNLLNAAALAMFDMGGVHALDLMPRDTGGRADGAASAAVEVLAHGADALIGPATPAAAANATRAATAHGAPILALTADRRMAEPGVFAMGHAAEASATRIVDFAYRRGVRVIAAIAPEGAYGKAALRGLEGAAAGRGMRVAAIQELPRDANATAIERATAAALAAVAVAPDAEGALFLPFPAEELAPFAAAIQARHRSNPPMLLGLEGWDSALLPKLPGFEHAYYAGADPRLSASFRARYVAAFGEAPARDAALVYDMTAMLAAAGRSATGRRLGAFDLTTAAGYRGVEGAFLLTPEGVVRRTYAVVGVRDGALDVIEPAPERFSVDG